MQEAPFMVFLAFGIVVGVGLLLRWMVGAPRRTRVTTHGSARWGDKADAAAAGFFTRRGVILGQGWGRLLRDDTEGHIAVVGATRSGKGLLLNCTLLDLEDEYSLLVTDPKNGQNYHISHAWRQQFGPVWVFAPFWAGQWTRLNVLQTIRLRRPEEVGDATLIAESLVAPEKRRRESETSAHFRELASMLLTAVFLHRGYTQPRTSLADAWRFMTLGGKDLKACLTLMQRTAHHHGGVHQAVSTLARAIDNITGDRELGSVWSTAIRPLSLYNDPRLAAATEAMDVILEELQDGAQPIALYLVAQSPLSLQHYHPAYRVILEVIQARLTEREEHTYARRRLLKIYDELASYGYMRTVEDGVAVEAGNGMRSVLILQDLEQLWDTYGEHTALWGNITTRVFQTIANDATAKRISERLLGESTVENPVVQQSPILGHRRAVSLQHTARELLKPDELMGLSSNVEIITRVGAPPLLVGRVSYRHSRAFRGRWADRPAPALGRGAP